MLNVSRMMTRAVENPTMTEHKIKLKSTSRMAAFVK